MFATITPDLSQIGDPQIKWVTKTGSANGNGSQAAPFDAVANAIASITDATSSKRYIVRVGPGDFSGVTFTLQPWIYVVGSGVDATLISPVSTQALGSGFVGGVGLRSTGLFDCTTSGQFKVDFAAIGSTGTDYMVVGEVNTIGNLVVTGISTTRALYRNVLYGCSGLASSRTCAINNLKEGDFLNVNAPADGGTNNLTITGTDAYLCQIQYEGGNNVSSFNVTWTGSNAANSLTITCIGLFAQTVFISGKGAEVQGYQVVNYVTGPIDQDDIISFFNSPGTPTKFAVDLGKNVYRYLPTADRSIIIDPPFAFPSTIEIFNIALSYNCLNLSFSSFGTPTVVPPGESVILTAAGGSINWDVSTSRRIPDCVNTPTKLKSFDGNKIADKTVVRVSDFYGTGNATPSKVSRTFMFVLGNTQADDGMFALAPTTNPSGGKWICCDPVVWLKIPWTFSVANNTAMFTMPTGMRAALINKPFWEITINAGGGGGAGAHTTTLTTPGTLVGAASGDVAANLTTTNKFWGSRGTGFSGGTAIGPVIDSAEQIIYDVNGAAFTSGAGYLHIGLQLLG